MRRRSSVRARAAVVQVADGLEGPVMRDRLAEEVHAPGVAHRVAGRLEAPGEDDPARAAVAEAAPDSLLQSAVVRRRSISFRGSRASSRG